MAMGATTASNHTIHPLLLIYSTATAAYYTNTPLLALLQVSGNITVARILQLQSMQFTVSDSSMFAALSGSLVNVPVAGSITLVRSGNSSSNSSSSGSNSSNHTFYVATAGPLGMSALLDRLWPTRPAVLSSFVSGLTFPAIAVAYTNATYTVEAVSGKPAQPFLALGSALNMTAPAIRYVDSPRAFSMAITVDIPAMGISATRATLQSSADQLTMQVRPRGFGWLFKQ